MNGYGLRGILVALGAAVLLAGCGGSPYSSEIYMVPDNIASPAPANALEEVARLINQERVAHGLKPLVIEAHLAAAASGHAQYMAVNDCYAHECPGEPDMSGRVEQTGYAYRRISENIHAAQLDPARVVEGWMQSPGHRKNILDPDVTEFGVGHYYLAKDGGKVQSHHYWVANFGAKMGLATSP